MKTNILHCYFMLSPSAQLRRVSELTFGIRSRIYDASPNDSLILFKGRRTRARLISEDLGNVLRNFDGRSTFSEVISQHFSTINTDCSDAVEELASRLFMLIEDGILIRVQDETVETPEFVMPLGTEI